MIIIPRSPAVRMSSSVVAWDRSRSTTPHIQLHTDESGLSIGIVEPDAGVTYHHSDQCGSMSLAASLELLKRCEGTKD